MTSDGILSLKSLRYPLHRHVLLKLSICLWCLAGNIQFAQAQSNLSRSALPAKSPAASNGTVKFGAGVGLDLPDIVPVELVGWTKYWGFRAFVSPPIGFDVRVEFPDDLISSNKGVEIEHPALNFSMDATYGPNYGAEVLVFPFGGGFFVDAGLSQRKFRLKGGVASPLIIRPAGSTESLTTKTIFGVNADAETVATMARASIGWIWRIFDAGYMKLSIIGAAVPVAAHTHAKVEAVVDAPGVENDDIQGAMAELKQAKEAELRDKAVTESKPAEELKMPIIGLSLGYIF